MAKSFRAPTENCAKMGKFLGIALANGPPAHPGGTAYDDKFPPVCILSTRGA